MLISLLLALSACAAPANQTPESVPVSPDAPDEAQDAPPVRVERLNVEFAIEGRDPEVLRGLQAAFPDALTAALAARNVTVGAVSVTFGASGDATAEAIRSGGVDLGFLSAQAALESGVPILALEQTPGPDSDGSVLAGKAEGWDEALTSALGDAAPAELLTGYAGQGGFVPAEEQGLSDLKRLYETGDTVLRRESADAGRWTLEYRGIGHKLRDGVWGLRAIEVWHGDWQVQTVELSDAEADGLGAYSECPDPAQSFRAVDVNFDGSADLQVCAGTPGNTVPCYFWLWDGAKERYVYGFTLQGVTVDPEKKTLTSVYRDSPEQYGLDTYEWQDGALVMIGSEKTAEWPGE